MAVSKRSKASLDKARSGTARRPELDWSPTMAGLPDVNSEAFRRQAHRESLAIANSPHAKEEQDWVDSVSVWPNEEE